MKEQNHLTGLLLCMMKKNNVIINDLYSLIGNNRKQYQRGENDVHYNDAGRDLLAKVVKVINKELAK